MTKMPNKNEIPRLTNKVQDRGGPLVWLSHPFAKDLLKLTTSHAPITRMLMPIAIAAKTSPGATSAGKD
jgi:hypothetical protein